MHVTHVYRCKIVSYIAIKSQPLGSPVLYSNLHPNLHPALHLLQVQYNISKYMIYMSGGTGNNNSHTHTILFSLYLAHLYFDITMTIIITIIIIIIILLHLHSFLPVSPILCMYISERLNPNLSSFRQEHTPPVSKIEGSGTMFG